MSFGGNLDMGKLDNYEQKLLGQWYKPPDRGDNIFICPPWKEGVPFNFYETKAHWVKGHGALGCPGSKGMPCPICEENAKLRGQKDNPQAQALSAKIYAKPAYLYNVIPSVRVNNKVISFAGDVDKAPEIKPWNVSKQLHTIILGFRGFYGNYCNPMDGVIIQLSRTQVMGNDGKPINKIVTNVNPNRGRLDDTLLALGDKFPQLDEMIPIKSYDELRAIIDVELAAISAPPARTYPSATIPNNPAINKNPLNPFGQPAANPGSVVIGGNTNPASPVQNAGPVKPITGNMHQLDSLDKMIAEQEAKKQEQGA